VLPVGDYNIRVRAWGSGGMGEFSPDGTFTYTWSPGSPTPTPSAPNRQ